MRVREFLYPSAEKDFLDEFIRERILGGKKNLEEQEEGLMRQGYDPDLIEGMGEFILTEFRRLEDLKNNGKLFGAADERWGRLKGLCTEAAGGKYTERSPLMAGLMSELAEEFRLMIKASMAENHAEAERVCFLERRAEVHVSEEEVRTFIEIRNGEAERCRAMEEQQLWIEMMGRKKGLRGARAFHFDTLNQLAALG